MLEKFFQPHLEICSKIPRRTRTISCFYRIGCHRFINFCQGIVIQHLCNNFTFFLRYLIPVFFYIARCLLKRQRKHFLRRILFHMINLCNNSFHNKYQNKRQAHHNQFSASCTHPLLPCCTFFPFICFRLARICRILCTLHFM